MGKSTILDTLLLVDCILFHLTVQEESSNSVAKY